MQHRLHGVVLASLAALAIVPYVAFLNLPFISDDYPVIELARKYGPVEGWAALAADPLYRCRATSLFVAYWIDRLFGFSLPAFNWASITAPCRQYLAGAGIGHLAGDRMADLCHRCRVLRSIS